jgi:hypothetical protein
MTVYTTLLSFLVTLTPFCVTRTLALTSVMSSDNSILQLTKANLSLCIDKGKRRKSEKTG